MNTHIQWVFTLLLLCAGCSPGAPYERESDEQTDSDDAEVAANTVESVIDATCSTSAVAGLSAQIIAEANCIEPNAFVAIPDRSNLVKAGDHVLMFLEQPARDRLVLALDAFPNRTMTVTSALRTVAQQLLLSRWGDDGVCGVELAAVPGNSNHETGLAIDVLETTAWRTALEDRGFSWLGPSDDVHFDYVGAGATDHRGLDVLAFQRLWNRNFPSDTIVADGSYGPATEARLLASPAAGFSLGPSCGVKKPIEVYWQRQSDSSYDLRALAPSNVASVEYLVDGFVIGSATRTGPGDNFPDSYTFTSTGSGRRFEVRGRDSQGAEVARGIGSIDVTPNAAFYVRQMGEKLYEVGLERPPAALAFVELRVDGFAVSDSVSGLFRTPRKAVRHKYNTLGPRSFALTTFNADGSVRGTIQRAFTLE
jgi:hypothetical protein